MRFTGSSFFLPLSIPVPHVSYLFLFFSLDILPPTLYFFSFCAFSSPSLPLPVCISFPFILQPSFPIAHCVQAAEEASSSLPCPESTCGSGRCFSLPSCARTSLSSKRLRQVRSGVPLHVPCPPAADYLHPASPACILGARAGSCFSLFGDLSLCKEGGLCEMIGRSGGSFWGFCITTHGFLACSVLPRGAEFPAELGYQTDEFLASL